MHIIHVFLIVLNVCLRQQGHATICLIDVRSVAQRKGHKDIMTLSSGQLGSVRHVHTIHRRSTKDVSKTSVALLVSPRMSYWIEQLVDAKLSSIAI